MLILDLQSATSEAHITENKTQFVVPATRMRVDAHMQALQAQMSALAADDEAGSSSSSGHHDEPVSQGRA